eukprot:jgi/Mesen1/4333/ME000022S03619
MFPINSFQEVSATQHAIKKLELECVSKAYGGRAVVNGVSLELCASEVVGLLGPNGAGKSTAFGLMVGREAPSGGRVKLGECDITRLSLERRARLGIGYLPQEASVFRGLSVRDNILLVLQETRVPLHLHRSRLSALLDEFRLGHVADTLGKALSGGERRRTELARTLAMNCSGGPPRFLLVDEPFAGVDPLGVQEIQGMLKRLCCESRMGILITDHNVFETLRICDRAYMMYNGCVMASGSPQELYENALVRKRYLGESFWHWPREGELESRAAPG